MGKGGWENLWVRICMDEAKTHLKKHKHKHFSLTSVSVSDACWAHLRHLWVQ